EIDAAFRRQLKNGNLREKLFTSTKQKIITRDPETFSVELVSELRPSRTDQVILPDPELATAYNQYILDMEYLADEIAKQKLANASTGIRQFGRNLNNSRRN